MNLETKRHIDGARQVLVGVVPNPVSQIDQITYALIYKFMDDMDQSSISEGGEPSFFTGILEPYSWTKLMDSRLGNQQRMNLYIDAFLKFSEAEQLPELFRNILKSAFLPYRSPEVLWLFLKEIDYFDYSHPEELGNAYEYLLSIMGSQGDAGQFRTPRHIIDFIVDVIQPTENDKILDPACGTGGFLVKAYQHILEQHQGDQKLTQSQKLKIMDQFEGYDIDPGMVRIAQVNMFLHQFKSPKIVQYDTLSMEEKWNDRFDVIMANPPFMSPKGGIKPHSKFSVQSTRSEVLFVDYIMNHLKPKGRAGIIVPEGIIFQSGNAYKQLRKNLVNDGLYAVVSLPSGVFQPYSGVKTSILFFNNEIAKQREEILFVKVENDGFDLGATKRPINKNDLPEAIEILNKWKDNEKPDSTKALLVNKTKLSENSDYNLSGDRYRVTTDYSNAKWPMVELGEILEKSGKNKVNDKIVPIMSITMNNGLIDQAEKFKKRIASDDLSSYKLVNRFELVVGFPIDEGVLGFQKKYDLAAVSPAYGIWKIKDGLKVDIEFLEIIFRSTKAREIYKTKMQGSVSRRRSIPEDIFLKIKIPLPPLEIQQQIVEELDSYQNIISGARQIIANWKPRIDIDPNWDKVKLGEVCNYAGGTQPPKSTFVDSPREGYIRLLQIRDYKTDENAVYIPKSERYKSCTDTDIMIGRYGPPVFQILKGKSGAYNVALMKCLPDNSKITNDWLFYFLNSDPVQEKIVSLSGRVRQSGVNPSDLNELFIPLPSIETQQQIVECIESERVLVESSKKLITLYTQKISTTLAKLWEE